MSSCNTFYEGQSKPNYQKLNDLWMCFLKSIKGELKLKLK